MKQIRITSLSLILLILLSILGFIVFLQSRRVNEGNRSFIVFANSDPTSILLVYNDSSLTYPLTQIDWGNISVGSENQKTAYFYNNSTKNIWLNMNTSNWSLLNEYGHQLPSSYSNYLPFYWNYNETPISANSTKEATFTLYVSFSITQVHTFSFNINIFAAGNPGPTILSTLVSTTKKGETATFSCNCSDKENLIYGILCTDISGPWINQTSISLTGSFDTFSDTATLLNATGIIIHYIFYIADNASQITSSEILRLTTTLDGNPQSPPSNPPSGSPNIGSSDWGPAVGGFMAIAFAFGILGSTKMRRKK